MKIKHFLNVLKLPKTMHRGNRFYGFESGSATAAKTLPQHEDLPVRRYRRHQKVRVVSRKDYIPEALERMYLVSDEI